MVVEKIQDLYPNENIKKIQIYMEIGIGKIKKYLEIDASDEYIEDTYPDALVMFLINTFDYEKDKGVITKKQGNKSITYSNSRKSLSLTNDVKELLPTPVSIIRVLG